MTMNGPANGPVYGGSPALTPRLHAQAVREAAAACGLAAVGLVRAQPAASLAHYERWLAGGLHGDMAYLARPDRLMRRRDLTAIVPGARTLIAAAVHYDPAAVDAAVLEHPARGRISAYAWHRDYHAVLGERLEMLAERLGLAGGGTRAYVDTGALLERAHAHDAGLGFIGKNTMLIHPRRGSFSFLGLIITDADADRYDVPIAPPAHDRPAASLCGTCTRCLAACPTGAFPTPYTLDARLCISYLTIEYKGVIPRELRPKLGNWVYGCDVCGLVCPWNRFAPRLGPVQSAPAADPAFAPPDANHAAPPLPWLLGLDDVGFRAYYADSPILLIGRARMVRNAAVAAGNAADSGTASADTVAGETAASLFTALAALLADQNALVRGHAAWAVGQWMRARPAFAGPARAALDHAHAIETDAAVLEEISHALTD